MRIAIVVLAVIFTLGCSTVSRSQVQSWSDVKQCMSQMPEGTHMEKIIAVLGPPRKQFATPSLPEEYVMLFDVPGTPGQEYFVMLDTKTKGLLYWSDEEFEKQPRAQQTLSPALRDR
jgi:hypothetical protein